MKKINSTLNLSANFERAGDLSKALSVLLFALNHDKKNIPIELYDLSIKRILLKAKHRAKSFMLNVCPSTLYENVYTPKSYASDARRSHLDLSPIISLTTISSRINGLEPVIHSIINQKIRPHSINLYISEEGFLIDDGIQCNNPQLKNIASMGVNIYKVPNIGPYRKQYPLIIQLRSNFAPANTPIITLDDDVVYPSNIVGLLMSALDSSDAVVAHRGREITFGKGCIAAYKDFSSPKNFSSHLNMGTGKNGIAYRLKYFPENYEDYLGHILAPTADDIWCKWATSLYCIPTIILEPTAAFGGCEDFIETQPYDKNGLFHVFNAKGSNDDAINNIEKYFSAKGAGVVALNQGHH